MAPTEKFPIDAAQIVGLFMESVFYGVLVWPENRIKAWSSLNHKMLFAALIMFIFASLDVAFGLRHNLDAFIANEEGAIAEFQDTSNWINVMKMGCYVGQTFIGDAILLYRCWVVYSKNWLVVSFPILLWLGNTVCGSATIYIEATLNTEGKLMNASKLIPFITSMLTLTLATNILTTGLIVYRIRSIQDGLKYRSATGNNNAVTNAMRVLIESGLMYTMTIIILFGLYLASSNGQFGVSNSVVQIIGITFNLIIIRADRGVSTQPTTLRSQNQAASHMINIQTTISRYPDEHTIAKSDDLEMTSQAQAKSWERA